MPNPPFGPMPVLFPLYPKPPFLWRNDVALNALCRMDPRKLAQVIPHPFKAASEDGSLFVAAKLCRNVSAPNANGFVCTEQYRLDFTIPIVFDGLHGEYPVLEYINDDMGLCVGRELWNWPKKLGNFKWEQTSDSLHFECWRNGEILATLDFAKHDRNEAATVWPASGPGLTVRPTSDGSRTPTHLEVIRTEFPNFVLHSRAHGHAEVQLHDGVNDRLKGFFGDLEVVDARLDVRDFDFDWGDVIATVPLAQADQESQSVQLVFNGTTGR